MYKNACYQCGFQWETSYHQTSCQKCGSDFVQSVLVPDSTQKILEVGYMQASSYDNSEAMRKISEELEKRRNR